MRQLIALRRFVLIALVTLIWMAIENVGICEDTTSVPNIVFIYADDLGYGDVSCYNPKRGKISTPHIDQLADQGMRFSDGHSSSGVCSHC